MVLMLGLVPLFSRLPVQQNTGFATGLVGHSATKACDRNAWHAKRTCARRFFLGRVRTKHVRQRYVTAGRDEAMRGLFDPEPALGETEMN